MQLAASRPCRRLSYASATAPSWTKFWKWHLRPDLDVGPWSLVSQGLCVPTFHCHLMFTLSRFIRENDIVFFSFPCWGWNRSYYIPPREKPFTSSTMTEFTRGPTSWMPLAIHRQNTRNYLFGLCSKCALARNPCSVWSIVCLPCTNCLPRTWEIPDMATEPFTSGHWDANVEPGRTTAGVRPDITY